MRAVLIDDDNALTWRKVPDPVRQDDEILVEIHAAALNRADLMQRAGNYPPPPGWPEWMGLEMAGIVLEAPAGGRWQPGDQVCALLGGGGYAEKVALPASMALPVPDGLSMAAAASIPEAFATAYLNLCLEAGLKSGDTVFIQAGASGLGMAAIQLVKHVGGNVVTAVGSSEKVEFVRGLGADVPINHRAEDVAAVLAEHPVDIALDCVCGPGFGPCIQHMARGGRWIVIATLGGHQCEIDLKSFFLKGLKLIGSTLRSRSPELKAQVLQGMEELLWPAFADRTIEPVIYQTLPIARAEEAHAILERRENIGKVVLEVR